MCMRLCVNARALVCVLNVSFPRMWDDIIY